MLGYATDMTTVGGWANLPKYPFADTRFWIDPQPYSPCGPLQDAVPASSERATPPLLPIHTTEEDALIVELKNLWADRIGAPVHADSNFFELAGTSIIALAILSDIEKSLGIRLPLATFFEAKTVRALAHILENKLAETLDLELA
jgi:acyl carrier protein